MGPANAPAAAGFGLCSAVSWGGSDFIGGLGARHVGFGDRRAVRVVGAAADQARLGFELRQAEARAGCRDLLDFGHHFGADAVAGEKEELVSRHDAPSLCWGCDAC